MNINSNQRKQHYIDHRIQGTLIIALVILEVTMVVAVLFYLNAQFERLLENTLYSIHPPSDEEIRKQIYWEIGIAVVWMSFINLCALTLAHVLWGGYVKRVMTSFREGVQSMATLQFSKPIEHVELHAVLNKLKLWQNAERNRVVEIKGAITALQKDLNSEYEVTSVVDQLEAVKSLCRR